MTSSLLAYPGVIHMHSDYSHDSEDALETLRETSIARGIRFVGMTDHAEDLQPEVFSEYLQHCAAMSDEQLQMIPGLEFRFAGMRGLHLFALGLHEWITPKTPEQFFDMTRDTAQMTVLAHPVLCGYRIPDVVFDRVDAIEIWNANYNTRYLPDPRSIKIVHELRKRRPELVATVGLDQHDSTNDRQLRVVLAKPSDDPIAELKRGAHMNYGKIIQFDAHASIAEGRLAALKTARMAFDIVERTQDKTVRLVRRLTRMSTHK